jgi:hypothetical protein
MCNDKSLSDKRINTAGLKIEVKKRETYKYLSG